MLINTFKESETANTAKISLWPVTSWTLPPNASFKEICKGKVKAGSSTTYLLLSAKVKSLYYYNPTSLIRISTKKKEIQYKRLSYKVIMHKLFLQ